VPFSRDYVEYLKTLPTEDKENAPLTDESALSRKVFIVHGRDEAARETVARFMGHRQQPFENIR
jgi:predicted nucleotide-binding protein